MKPGLISLKYVIHELLNGMDIKNFDDRKKVQKAIYLGQRLGVNLGYRYNWYLEGPYSPDLTTDYYELKEAEKAEQDSFKNRTLKEDVKETLRPIQDIINPPQRSGLSQSSWLELLASIDFQRKVLQRTDEDTRKIISDEKDLLEEYYDDALRALVRAGLNVGWAR